MFHWDPLRMLRCPWAERVSTNPYGQETFGFETDNWYTRRIRSKHFFVLCLVIFSIVYSTSFFPFSEILCRDTAHWLLIVRADDSRKTSTFTSLPDTNLPKISARIKQKLYQNVREALPVECSLDSCRFLTGRDVSVLDRLNDVPRPRFDGRKKWFFN